MPVGQPAQRLAGQGARKARARVRICRSIHRRCCGLAWSQRSCSTRNSSSAACSSPSLAVAPIAHRARVGIRRLGPLQDLRAPIGPELQCSHPPLLPHGRISRRFQDSAAPAQRAGKVLYRTQGIPPDDDTLVGRSREYSAVPFQGAQLRSDRGQTFPPTSLRPTLGRTGRAGTGGDASDGSKLSTGHSCSSRAVIGTMWGRDGIRGVTAVRPGGLLAGLGFERLASSSQDTTSRTSDAALS